MLTGHRGSGIFLLSVSAGVSDLIGEAHNKFWQAKPPDVGTPLTMNCRNTLRCALRSKE